MHVTFDMQNIIQPSLDGGIYKSPYDKRNYKQYILPNGIKVLLISDPNVASDDIEESVDEHEDVMDDENSSEGSQDLQDDSEDESDEGSDENNKYSKNMASVAVCVHTGSIQDPRDIPGLSHFLEHMLFMGSSEYPDPSDFGNFISSHGGSYNAYTCMEQTNYFFSIPVQFLNDALHRFVQFFISPILLKETIENERIAVDNEFQAALQNDFCNFSRLLQTLMFENHPASSFFNGNLISLKKNVEIFNINLSQRVKEHYENHYSSEIMTSVIYAPLSIENLDELVTTYLCQIPHKKAPKDHLTIKWNHVFDPNKFHRLYRMKTLDSAISITISWPTPPQIQHYKTKPLEYISFLLGHEGKGTLFSYLKNRNWVYKLMAGCSSDGTLNNTYFSLFQIYMELSDEGVNNINHIIQSVFFYIKLIRMNITSKRIFEEISLQSYIEFMFSHMDDPCNIVSSIASSMKHLLPEDYLMGNTLYYEYDADGILECLTCLKPGNTNIILGSNKFIFSNPEYEFWCKIIYSSEEIPSDWFELLQDPIDDLFLPRLNTFMPSNLNISPPDSEYTTIPRLLSNESNLKVYYLYDNIFNHPKCCVRYSMDYDFGSTQDTNIIIQLYCFAFAHIHQECIYEAEMAKIYFTWNQLYDGKLCFIFDGLSDNIHILISYIFQHFTRLTLNETKFEFYKNKLISKINDSLQKQDKYTRELCFHLLKTDIKTKIDFKDELLQLKYDQYLHLQNILPTIQVSVTSLICGCITQQNALEIAHIPSKYLNIDSRRLHFMKSLFVCLPLGSCLYRTPSLRPNDSLITISNIYQCDILSMEQITGIILIKHLLNPFVFEKLRDEEQLGYEVYSHVLFAHYVPSIVICVVGDLNKSSITFIDERIENLLIQFQEYIDKMSDIIFNKKKEGLRKKKTQIEANLEKQTDQYFDEIIIEKYIFDRNYQQSEILKNLKKSDIIKLIMTYLDKKSIYRKKLSIQITNETLNNYENENYEIILKNNKILKERYINELLN